MKKRQEKKRKNEGKKNVPKPFRRDALKWSNCWIIWNLWVHIEIYKKIVKRLLKLFVTISIQNSSIYHFRSKVYFIFFLTRSFFCVYTKADIPLFALCLENNGRLPYKSWHVILIETFIIHILAIASSSWCNRNSFLEWKHMTLIEKEIRIDIFSPN